VIADEIEIPPDPDAEAAYAELDAWVAAQGFDADDYYRRSRVVVVGGPTRTATAALLLGVVRHAPVALVDPDLIDQLGWYTRHADVLIVAAGLPGLIRAEHVRAGAIVIDTATDVAVQEVAARAGAVIRI
jgi:methylenetetrahydrofolate dehydrogenase (NADP+)/methenyltetrahydrofolate cyclohydrolase